MFLASTGSCHSDDAMPSIACRRIVSAWCQSATHRIVLRRPLRLKMCSSLLPAPKHSATFLFRPAPLRTRALSLTLALRNFHSSNEITLVLCAPSSQPKSSTPALTCFTQATNLLRNYFQHPLESLTLFQARATVYADTHAHAFAQTHKFGRKQKVILAVCPLDFESG